MYYSIREEKIRLRKKFSDTREMLDEAEKGRMDKLIFDNFTSLVSYRYADTLLMYYPKSKEVDTLPIIKAALASGKKVALPVCHDDGYEMSYSYIGSLEDLEKGKYGILAPKKDCKKFIKEDVHRSIIIVVPALAFDNKGYRLGYGKGYYDRYMDGLVAVSVGLAYSQFVVDDLPVGRYDLACNLLVTEKGVKIIEVHK